MLWPLELATSTTQPLGLRVRRRWHAPRGTFRYSELPFPSLGDARLELCVMRERHEPVDRRHGRVDELAIG